MSSDLRKAFEPPPKGDIAWLWYRPTERPGKFAESQHNGDDGYHTTAQCGNCNVRWIQFVFSPRKPLAPASRCWCCGRFQKQVR